jgi:hydrogenase maturation protease
MAHLSLHEVDILNVIKMAKQIGQCPDEIVIFGIEPVSITQQLHLNESIQAKISDYIATIAAEIRQNSDQPR